MLYSQSSRFLLLLISFLFAYPLTALSHEERNASVADRNGVVPKYRTTGGNLLVVCKEDSKERIKKLPPELKSSNMPLLRACKYSSIQNAIDAAKKGDRIVVLPGIYNEEQHIRMTPDPLCQSQNPADGMYEIGNYGTLVPTYKHHAVCPHDTNLIAIIGNSNPNADPNSESWCDVDSKCNLQITGSARPEDVLIQGYVDPNTHERLTINVIRVDRADGIYLGNFSVQYSDFNNIYVIETDGFVLNNIVTRYSEEYGVLSFASTRGLYDSIEAYGNGDSGVYPGSGPLGKPDPNVCEYTKMDSKKQTNKLNMIEMRNINSHHNTVGLAGTAGNNIWIHDSKFHDNAVGIGTESTSAGHPGMPQRCNLIEKNQIYANNFNPYAGTNLEDCADPFTALHTTCPKFITQVGSGIVLIGGNQNLIRKNYIYDNHRVGIMSVWAPAFFREFSPSLDFVTHAFDTSHKNKFIENIMGMDKKGSVKPNGAQLLIPTYIQELNSATLRQPDSLDYLGTLDFFWDGVGIGNYWQSNRGISPSQTTYSNMILPNESNPSNVSYSLRVTPLDYLPLVNSILALPSPPFPNYLGTISQYPIELRPFVATFITFISHPLLESNFAIYTPNNIYANGAVPVRALQLFQAQSQCLGWQLGQPIPPDCNAFITSPNPPIGEG